MALPTALLLRLIRSHVFVMIALLGLGFISPDRAEASCGEENCIGEDACKDSSNIGNDCPTGAGSFCVITCSGKASCSGNAKFKPASESGHIICSGEDACKDAQIQLQSGADASQWKRTCTGSNACGGNFSNGGVGTCSGGSCPTCSISSLQFPAEADSWIEEKDPDETNPTYEKLKVKQKNNDDKRALMRFDLSALPVNAILSNVYLSVDVEKKQNNHTVLIREVNQSWTESGVSWDDRSSNVSWSTEGGSYESDLVASFSAASTGRKTISSSALSALVSGWADGSIVNNGLIFVSDGSTDKEIKISSRETGSDAPYLYVEYEISCAADEYVSSNTCTACPAGTTNAAGDDPSGGDTTCTDINECTANTDDCDANATCTNTTGGFTCSCNSGFTGDGTTCTDVDECATNNGDCDSLTTCTNNVGADPTCGACPSGYSGDGDTGCTDINECATNNGGCDSLTTCTNNVGADPTCGACPSGYSGNGDSGCTDINECATNNGGCDSLTTCTNNAGADPTCGACPSGYSGDGDTGCTDINECVTNNGGCDSLTTCTNNVGADPTCGACPSGYSGDGDTGCTDVNECDTNNGGCDSLTTCTNNLGADPTCGACPSGYSGDGDTGCTDINECATNCLLYTSPSPRDLSTSRMPSSA